MFKEAASKSLQVWKFFMLLWSADFIKLTFPKKSFMNTIKSLNSLDPDLGPCSAVGNVSGYRCVSDCRSRGREFDPGPVPYFRGD